MTSTPVAERIQLSEPLDLSKTVDAALAASVQGGLLCGNHREYSGFLILGGGGTAALVPVLGLLERSGLLISGLEHCSRLERPAAFVQVFFAGGLTGKLGLVQEHPDFDRIRWQGEGANWRHSARWKEADAVVACHSNTRTEVQATLNRVAAAWAGSGPDAWSWRQLGHVERRGQGGPRVEPFGFRDGVSGPRFTKDGSGFPAPVSSLLLNQPFGDTREFNPVSWCVLMKLEQDVVGFWRAIGELADRLDSSREEVAELAMGRRLDGQPLKARPDGDVDFRGDWEGKLCPFHSHVRTMNPRGQLHGSRDDWSREAHHRETQVARRSVVFRSGQASGLIFVAFHSDLVNRLRLLLGDWASSGRPNSGADALLAEGPHDGQAAHRWWRDGRWQSGAELNLQSFVVNRGGVLLYVPSLPLINWLAHS